MDMIFQQYSDKYANEDYNYIYSYNCVLYLCISFIIYTYKEIC